MTVVWTLNLHCNACGADIQYQDEIPKIEKDRTRTIYNNRATSFATSHTYKQGDSVPPQVKAVLDSMDIVYQAELLPEKYVVCVVCGERIYFGD